MEKLIRKAEFSDLDGILELLYQLSPNNEQTSKFEIDRVMGKILNNSDYYLNVCESDKILSGTSMFFIQQNLSHGGRPVGHVENVVVDKNYRGQGISKLLVNDLLKFSNLTGCYKTILDCSKKNVPVYASMNFKETGEVQMRLNPNKVS